MHRCRIALENEPFADYRRMKNHPRLVDDHDTTNREQHAAATVVAKSISLVFRDAFDSIILIMQRRRMLSKHSCCPGNVTRTSQQQQQRGI